MHQTAVANGPVSDHCQNDGPLQIRPWVSLKMLIWESEKLNYYLISRVTAVNLNACVLFAG
jgi:hypothetical protein